MNSKIPFFGLVLIIWLLSDLSAKATLQVCILNDQTMFVASDSLLTMVENTNQTDSHLTATAKKIFLLSDKCCVTSAYWLGYTDSGGHPSFLTALDTICVNMPKNLPLTNKIDDAISDFGAAYVGALNLIGAETNMVEPDLISTEIQFSGYDTNKKTFFLHKFSFLPQKGIIPIEAADELGEQHQKTNYVQCSGDTQFFIDLLKGAPKLNDLLSTNGRQTANLLLRNLNASPSDILNLIVECFNLQEKYYTSRNYGELHIGPPYVIYRITSEKMERVY